MTNPHILTTLTYSSEPPSRGRRHCKRYPAYFDVTLTGLAGREPPVTGFITNVSQQGVRVMTPIALPIGQVVKLQIADSVLFGEIVSSSAEGDYFRTGVRVRRPESGASVAGLLREILVEPVPVRRYRRGRQSLSEPRFRAVAFAIQSAGPCMSSGGTRTEAEEHATRSLEMCR